MATRIKTILYHFDSLDSLPNNTLTNLPQLTINIPEAAGTVTFKSVFLKVNFDDIITATGGTISTKTLTLRLGSNPYTTITNTAVLSHSGENISAFIIQDFTSTFNTYWSGTSMTCDAQILLNQTTGTTLGFVNVCGTLYITYEYDEDINNTFSLIKTVWIPVSNFNGSIPTTTTELGVMPDLSTYLPEDSKVYRNIALVFMANTHTQSTTNTNLSFYIDGSLNKTITHVSALATDRFIEYNFIINSSYANNSHSLQFVCDVSDRYTNPILYLVVTYEYNYSNSSNFINSLIIPFNDENIYNENNAPDSPNRIKIKYNIVEKDVMFLNLGIYGFFSSFNTGNIYFRINDGSYTTLISTGSGVVAGQKTFQYSTNDYNIANFNYGERIINLDVYTSNYLRNTAIKGFIILVYTFSERSVVINRNVFYMITSPGSNSTLYKLLDTKPLAVIPETDYYLVNYGICVYYISNNFAQQTTINILTSETNSYYVNLIKYFNYADTELGAFYNYNNIDLENSIIQRFPNQLNKISPLINRKINVSSTSNFMFGVVAIYNYYSYNYNLSGVTYDNNGSILPNCDVYLYKKEGDKIEFVNKTISDSNGNYSFTIYEYNKYYFVSAYKSGNPNVYDISDFIVTQ